MKKHISPTFTAIIVAATMLLNSCSDDRTNSTGSTNYTLASISGKVMLFDTIPDIFNNNNGINIPNASGVTIRIEAQGILKTTTTDSSGYWELKNFPAGACDISIIKDGFTPYIQPEGWYVSGEQHQGILQMHRISKISVNITQRPFEDYEYKYTSDTLVYDSVGNLNREIHTNSIFIPNGRCVYSSRILDDFGFKPQRAYGVLYLSREQDIDPLKANSYTYSSGEMQYGYIDKIANFEITTPMLLKAGFKSGETVYCSVFAAKQNTISSMYSDLETRKNIRTGLSPNHSPVVSFIVP